MVICRIGSTTFLASITFRFAAALRAQGVRSFSFAPSERPRSRAPPARRRSSAPESRGRGSRDQWRLRGGGRCWGTTRASRIAPRRPLNISTRIRTQLDRDSAPIGERLEQPDVLAHEIHRERDVARAIEDHLALRLANERAPGGDPHRLPGRVQVQPRRLRGLHRLAAGHQVGGGEIVGDHLEDRGRSEGVRCAGSGDPWRSTAGGCARNSSARSRRKSRCCRYPRDGSRRRPDSRPARHRGLVQSFVPVGVQRARALAGKKGIQLRTNA